MNKDIFSYENIFKNTGINKIQDQRKKSQNVSNTKNEIDNKSDVNIKNKEKTENVEKESEISNNTNKKNYENENKIKRKDNLINSKQKIKKDIYSLFYDKNEINNKKDKPFNFYYTNEDSNIAQCFPTYNINTEKDKAIDGIKNVKDTEFTKHTFTIFNENEQNLVKNVNHILKDNDKERAIQNASTIDNIVHSENNLSNLNNNSLIDNIQLYVKKENENQEEETKSDNFMCFCFGKCGTFFYTQGSSIAYGQLINIIDKEVTKKVDKYQKHNERNEINEYIYTLKHFPGPFSRRNNKIDEKIKKFLNKLIKIKKEKYKDNIFEDTQK